MPNFFSARRNRSPLRLTIRSADDAETPDDAVAPPRLSVPPAVSAVAAGLGAAVVGWLGALAIVLFGWLTARAGDAGAAFGVAAQLWLAGHGGGFEAAGTRWTLIPLGLSALLVVLVRLAVTWVVRTTPPDAPRRRWWPGLAAAAYAGSVGLAGLVLGSGMQGVRTLLGAVVIAALGAAWAVLREPDLDPRALLPGWARALPTAAATGVWAVLLAGSAALLVSLIQHRERVATIGDGLGVADGSVVPVVVAQLLFWPNLMSWAASWTLGAGFRVGEGSIVSPASTDLGMLPSIPIFGALPNEGAGTWLLLWLISGVVAGVLAAVVVLRARPMARLEEATLVSGLAGVLAALVLLLLGVASSGSLGAERLTGLGPRLPELALLGGALLGLSALVTGLLVGGVRAFRRRGAGGEPEADEPGAEEPEAEGPETEDEDTRVLGTAGDRVQG